MRNRQALSHLFLPPEKQTKVKLFIEGHRNSLLDIFPTALNISSPLLSPARSRNLTKKNRELYIQERNPLRNLQRKKEMVLGANL